MTDLEKQQEKERQQKEWMALVHEGACCAYEDPHKEEKAKLIDDIRKEAEDKKKVSK